MCPKHISAFLELEEKTTRLDRLQTWKDLVFSLRPSEARSTEISNVRANEKKQGTQRYDLTLHTDLAVSKGKIYRRHASQLGLCVYIRRALYWLQMVGEFSSRAPSDSDVLRDRYTGLPHVHLSVWVEVVEEKQLFDKSLFRIRYDENSWRHCRSQCQGDD